MNEATLVSLAILKVNWDNGQDYIQNFVPFVAEAVRQANQNEVSVVEVQQIVRDEFGLIIPQGALNTLLRRLQGGGYVRREHGIYVRNERVLDASFERMRKDATRQHDALLEKFIGFCKSKHNVELTREEAHQVLHGYLQSDCIPILAAAVEGCAIPPTEQKVAHSAFLISSFIVALDESDPDGFAFLETVVKGSMLATALFIPDISQAKRKFDQLTVYLDTPLLLRAMGLEGECHEAATKELLELLYGLNVNGGVPAVVEG